jgi:hypothetical protein
MRVIRVFPRRTRATPNDALAYFGPPDLIVKSQIVDTPRPWHGGRYL